MDKTNFIKGLKHYLHISFILKEESILLITNQHPTRYITKSVHLLY